MTTEIHPGARAIQSNRHLKEWKENVVLERQSQYDLRNKHIRECEQLLLTEPSITKRTALRKQQAAEVQDLAQQQREIRLAIQQRHLLEIASVYTDQFGTMETTGS